jgi:Icc protein
MYWLGRDKSPIKRFDSRREFLFARTGLDTLKESLMQTKPGDQIPTTNADAATHRRGFLKCMAWAGTGLIWTMSGGVPSSRLLGAPKKKGAGSGFSFVQISDSHIGFNKPANSDVTGTLKGAVDKINGLSAKPDFLIHTGDLTHSARPLEFEAMDGVLERLRAKELFFVPGEHDTTGDDGKFYLARYGQNTKGRGWYSFDHHGVHFIGLNNVVQLEGFGNLGAEQLAWLEKDVAGLTVSTPLVIFAHIPLWAVYPEWGWGTKDGAEALSLVKRFGSVTVLNGHIHQTLQKIEGNVTFHTAMSTAFPQPSPGSAPSPGPLRVPAGALRYLLGITKVKFVTRTSSLAVVDDPLEGWAT